MRGRIKNQLLVTSLVLCGLGATVSTALAATANISHSYKTDTDVTIGSLVSLDQKRSDYVLPATATNGADLLGVAVAGGESLLAVNSDVNRLQVATSGSVPALVSTLNGDIKVGDQVAVSAFEGIGAKALPNTPIIGLAQTAFTAKTPGASERTVTDTDGHSKKISVGNARLTIGLGTASTAVGTEELNSLQKSVRSLSGRTIPTTRIVISFVVALVALVAIITLIHASIYSGIISIGRNPLAKYAVLRSLVSVLGMALLLAVVAVITVVFILH